MGEKLILFGHELEFDEEKHLYRWAGAPVPGVTTILGRIAKGQHFNNWFIKVTRDYWLDAVKAGRTDFEKIHKESWNAGKNISRAAADIGTNVHAYAECFFKKQPLPELLTDQAKRGAEAFHKWFDSHKIRVIASERMVFSKEHYYAGTCDLIAEIDGELVVGDIKTGSGIYNEARFQTAAYQHALQEEKGILFPSRLIIRFDKPTGNFELKTLRDFELDFRGFLAARELHRVLQTLEDETVASKALLTKRTSA
jgi:hypothetical protein